MKKVFITGATGTVGSWICRTLIQKEYSVTALKRSSSKMDPLSDFKEDVKWISGNLSMLEEHKSEIQRADIVIHCAAIISFGKDTISDMYQINVEATKSLLSLTAKNALFVYMGSGAGLGKPSGSTMINEQINSELAHKNTHYATTKYLAERAVWEHSKSGSKILILNPPVVMGVGDWSQSSNRFIDYVYKGKKFYPSGTINLVDVRDLADCCVALIERGITNQRFIISASHLSYKTYFEKIASSLNCLPPPKELTKPWSSVLWRIALVVSFFTRKKPFVTKESAQSTSSKYIYDNSKIRKLLNYEFRSIDNSIKWVCDAFLKEKSQSQE